VNDNGYGSLSCRSPIRRENNPGYYANLLQVVQQSGSIDQFHRLIPAEIVCIRAVAACADRNALVSSFVHNGAVQIAHRRNTHGVAPTFGLLPSISGTHTNRPCDRNFGQELRPLFASPLPIVVACGVVAFASDSVGSAVWAIWQDIGGRYEASTMAWTNMWGNFGASAVANVIPFILATRAHYGDWREIFWLCAGAFVLLAVALLFVDSTKSLRES
jgi:hypothetical protein